MPDKKQLKLQQSGRYDLADIDVALALKNAGVPQQSNYWYSYWAETGDYSFHRNFNGANSYLLKQQETEGKDVQVELVAAFHSSELDTMLCKVWELRKEPVPVFEDDQLFWVINDFNIKETNIASAKGWMLVAMLNSGAVTLTELYIPPAVIQ